MSSKKLSGTKVNLNYVESSNRFKFYQRGLKYVGAARVTISWLHHEVINNFMITLSNISYFGGINSIFSSK